MYIYALSMTSTITVDVIWNIEWTTWAEIVLFDLKFKNMSCVYGLRTNVHPLQGIWDYNSLQYLVNGLSLMWGLLCVNRSLFCNTSLGVVFGSRSLLVCLSVCVVSSISLCIYFMFFFRGWYTCCSIFCRVNTTIEFNSFWHRYLRQSFCKHRIRIRQQFRKI